MNASRSTKVSTVLSTTSATSDSQIVSSPVRLVSSVRPSRRSPSSTSTRELGVVAQVRLAMQPKSRLATAVGFMLGGFVPLATYWVSHNELGAEWPLYLRMLTYGIVAGGLLYSARTVFAWGKLAFHAPAKALGFVVLLEGVMTLSHTSWLSVMALVYLIAINGFATGCNLALPKSQTQALN